MTPDSRPFRTTIARALRQALPWVLAFAAATCTDDQNGPTHGGRGYFGFRPVYGINGSLSQFGIVADSVHVKLIRPVDQVVLDTTVFFPADSSQLRLALPVTLETSPESLSAVIGISSGATLLFLDTLDVSVVDGPPSVANIPTALLAYVGPGKNVAAVTLTPGDTTLFLGDTLFFSATAVDSSAAPVGSFFVGWKSSDTTVAKINGAGRLIAPNLRGSVKVIGSTPTGIADTTTVTFAPVPTQILADSGDLQAGIVADSLGALFVAKVIGADNLGISGIEVRWRAVKPGGAIRDTLLVTDAQGRVRTRGVFGDSVATYTYSATVVSKPALVRTFSGTAAAAAPSAIVRWSGDQQTDSAGRALAGVLQALVTDAFGNPVSGAKVYWLRTVGSGTLGVDSTFTDGLGLATNGFTLGAVGVDSITATLAGTSAFAAFQATAISGAPATATKVFGDTQTAVVGQLLADSLAVVVKSATNFPVVGGRVVWTVLRGGATGPDTTFTDVNGRTAIPYTLGTVSGPDSVRAQAGAVAATFTATAQAAAPSAIAIFSGNTQVDTANRALPQPLVVSVTDTFGNPVLNTPVTFTRIAGHGHVASDTVTAALDNHPGTAYTFGSIPGTDSVRATLLATGTSVTFAATAVNATPASVIQTHGSGINATVGTLFADSLIVQVLDVNDAPIALEKVIWTVTSGSGAVSLDTVLTDSLGFAVQHVTAGSTAGALVVNAKVVTPIPTVDFALTTSAGAPTAIALVSGDAQTDTTGKVLPLPLQVHVTDAFGNAIAGAKVAWQTVHGSGVPAADTTLTDATGNASTGYTLGAVPGTDTVRATLAGTGAFVNFTAGTVSGAPAGLLKLLGDAQVDTVLATLTDSLVVQLKDGSNTPIPNAWLYWIAAGITLSADSTLTDAAGRAAVQATFGSAAAKLVVAVRNVDTTVAAVFNLRAKAGVATQLNIVGGDLQSAPVNAALAQPFRVIAQDAHGNPADSIRVAFLRLAGSGTLNPDTAVTDTLGLAASQYTLGGVAGSDTVQAKLVGGTTTVTFTATGTAGAVASLNYSSGTGQSDTVHATLATPFTVVVRDAGNNPVPGVWVHFTRIRGSGTVTSDSNVTDLSGATATGYTLGTAAGLDSVVATITGTPDTVAFYALTTAGAPQALAIVAGDSQSAAVSTTLPAPFAVRVTDQFANPIVGATVAFDTTATGGTIAGAAAVTDATGLATSGAVTLGAAAGTSTFLATTPALPADTARFIAVALPIGTSSQWTGTLSSNWGTAGNWSPAAIPSSADNVFIPASAPNQPVLDAARSIGGLQVESGATLALGANTLTTVGNTQVDGTLSRTSGLLLLSASTGTARGNLAGVRVTGNITLNGATTVADSLQLTSGSLVVGGQVLTINGAFSDNGSGTFTMTNPADSVTVTGATLYNGSSVLSVLTAGTLVFKGNFTESSGSTLFQGTGTHTTVFAGAAPQTVTFAAASIAGNHFQHVIFANAAGVTLGGNIAATGNASITAGVVTGAARTAFLGGSLSDPTSLGWNVATTSLAGNPLVLPDTIFGNLDVTGTVTLAKDLVVKGNLTPNGASTLAFGGFRMRVDGGLTVSGGAQVLMQNPTDTLEVAGATSWNGSTSAGLLTNGVLVLRGSFSEPTGSAVFQGSGTHKTLFAGSAPQTVAFAAAGLAGNRFADVEFANPAGVSLTGNAAAAGTGAVSAGVVTGSSGTVTITVGGNVVDPTSTSWQVPTTVLAGTPSQLPDSFPAGVTVTGTVTLAKSLVIKGAYAQSAGAFTPNGFHVRLDSTFTLTGGQVLMQSLADTLDIAGTASWNGSTLGGQLTAGTLIFRGNFSEPSGSTVFSASGTHTTLFAGTAPQTAGFAAQGLAGNHFQDLVVQNAAGVNFTGGGAAAGNAAVVAGGVVTSSAGQVLTVNGDLSDPTSVSWRPEVTSLTGTPAALPDSFVRNVTISGTVTLSHPVAFKANLSATNGAFAPNGFHVRVDSALNISGNAQVKMQNGADTLDVAGLATWNGSTSAGLLTAGTLILRGDFSEPSGSTVFSATGTHTTLFAGAALQTVSFGAQSLASNHFQDLVVQNAGGVNFTAGATVAGNAAVASGGVVTTNAGQVVTVAGNVTDPTSVSWRPEVTSLTGTPTILPDSFARNVTVSGTVTLAHGLAFKANLSATNGAVTLNGFHVRVDSALNISGNAQVKMQNGADTLDVAGLATWNGSTAAGLLTAGTLILRGDFSEPSGSTVFSATGTHVTVLAGSALQTLSFGAQSLASNHFQDLVIADAAGANFTAGAAVAGNASVTSGFLTTNAGQTVTVAGNITDPTSVAWRPETTSLTGTPTVLPDSFTRNVTVSGTFTAPHAMAFRANVASTNGTFALNGQHLRVDSAFAVSGNAQVTMQNAADTLDIAGTATWNGSTTAGLLTAGTLILRGDFSEPSGSSVFQASGTHRTVVKGAVTHAITFGAPSAAGNRFNKLRLEGPAALALGSNLFVNDSLSAPLGLPVTIGSTAGVRTVATRGLQLNGVTFDSVRVGYSGGPIAFLQNVTFQHQDPTTVQFAIAEAGSATPEQFQNVQFLTTPTTGKYISATDTLANGSPLTVQMFHSFPLDGTLFEQQAAGADGATIDWSSFKFLIQPLDAAVLGVLDTVQVEVKAPDGNPDANFTGNVALAIGANPGSATLGGTTTVAAVLGVAKFGDLTLSAAGFGFTLVANTAGIAPDTSSLFNITVPLPAGFTSQWFGTTSTDWFTATNWSTGTVPDSTTNVFISGVAPNAPTLPVDSAFVKRLQLAPGAKLTLNSGTKLVADSSVQIGDTILGGGSLELRGTGTFTGAHLGSQTMVTGAYSVLGSASAFDLEITGRLTVAADTLAVPFLLQVSGNGQLYQTSPASLVDVGNTAGFNGNVPDTGLVDGTLRIQQTISAFGGIPNPFMPSGNHVTEFTGGADHLADFFHPDSVGGSHFANVRVNGPGKVTFSKRIDALGQIQVLQGTLLDSLGQGMVAHQGLSVATGATLTVGGELRSGGPITVAVGGSYAVPTTTYFGAGAPITIDAIPYDTLQIQRAVTVGADFVVPSELRISNGGPDAGRFDLKGHTVTVTGNVNVNGDGAVVEQDPADQLIVGGDFFTNGANTEGLLTAGVLQVAGNFRQAADVSSAAFRASPGHVTRFTGGAGHRTIKFDSPINNPADSTNSKFGDLDLASGVDSLSNNGVFAERVTLGGSIEYDTAFGGELAALDSMIVTAGAGTLHLSQLDLYRGIAVAAGPTYAVGTTAYFGGTTLPALPYQSVLVSGPALTMNANVTATGSFGIGQAGEVGGTAGDLIVNGHTLRVGGSFATGGFGLLTMAAGDSVDVGADITFNGGNTAGHLTGGTLIGRGNFSANAHSGDSTFVAGKAHRTVLMDTLASTLYVNTLTESGMQFGKLILLDAAPRAISTFGSRLIVQDSLVLGTATGGLGTGRVGAVLAKGPVFTVSGSAIDLSSFQADSTLAVNGSWSVTSSIFGGQGQLVPNLTYDDVAVLGTAALTDSLILASGNTLVVGGAGIPANLDLAGHQVRTGSFVTTEFGTITMVSALDTLDALVSATFDGADESGKLTNGVFRFHGAFTQANTHSDSSFVATGANETRFTDSSAVVQVHAASMATGRSRFNNVTITGSGAGTGVVFLDPVWIGGNAGVASPTIDQVHGPSATIAGTLNDVGALPAVWAVDTTTFLTHQGFLPARIGGSVVFTAGVALADSLDVAGFVHVTGGSLTPNGHGLNVHGDLATSGLAVFGMGALDTVRVDSSLTLAGGTIGTNFLGGLLQVGKDISVPVSGAFDAAPAHQTVMSGIHQRTVSMAAGNAFGKFDYSDSTYLLTDVHIRGRVTGSGETPGVLGGVDSLLTLDDSVAQGVQFTDLRVRINESHPLFDVTFQEMNPARTQITMVGAGRPAPVDLSVIRFHTLPSTGRFVDAVDTLANGDSLIVRMLGSTPFQGQAFSGGTGEAAVKWTRLTFTTLPLTVDSLVPFTVVVAGVGPDGANYNANQLDIALAANPANDALGGTLSQGFLFGLATFNDLVLHTGAAGVSFHVAVQHGAGDSTVVLDSATSALITVLNPAPAGAIVFDGGAADGLWSSALNWSTDVVPLTTDSVFIPGGSSVTFDVPVDTVGTLVLGAGASLNIAPGDSLYSLGRVSAGNTIAGTGTLVLAGGAQQVSGFLPNTLIKGSVSAVGPVSVNGSLTIDGAAAEFNVGGKRVDVSNTLATMNGGLLTMDGAADTVFAGGAAFGGGDETNRLIDGVFVLQGTSFTESGGDPNSFNTGGAFKLVFGSAGGPTSAFLSDPSTSHFNHVAIQNPAGVDLSGNSGDDVHILGDLVVSAGGVVHGPQVHVAGNVTSTGPNDSIGFVTLKLDKGLTVGGGYSVINTNFVGDSQVVPALPYQSLIMAGANARLGANVLAGNVFVTDTMFTMAGHTLHTPFLNVQSSGRLVMTNVLDTVIVDTTATIQGGDQTGLLTAGGLVLNGDLNLGIGTFRATRDFGTRFASGHGHHVSASFSFEGLLTPGVDYSNHLGSVDVIGDSVIVTDPGHIGLTLAGDLKLFGATWTDSLPISGGVGARVQGAVEADVGSVVSFTNFRVDSTLAITTPANYSVTNTLFGGAGQTIPALPYQRVLVEGNATLGAPVTTTFTWVQHQGRLDLGGHTLTVDTSLFVNDSAHLVMHTPADILNVLGTATFQGIDATGDLTAGTILAQHLYATAGTSGDHTSFVQTGSNRYAPAANDTITMDFAGPAEAQFKTIDFSTASGPVTVHGLWAADTVIIANPATAVAADTGLPFMAAGAFVMSGGTANIPRLALEGTLSVTGGTYVVDTTVFAGFSSTQTIPSNIPYGNIAVLYNAVLADTLDLLSGGHGLVVMNTGLLDLNGHTLQAGRFETRNTGRLKMSVPGDTLRAATAFFGGGNTSGLMTDGVLQVGDFQQDGSNDVHSFAPSGTQVTEFVTVGLVPEGGYSLQMDPATAGAAGSHFNRLSLLSTAGTRLFTNVYAADALFIDNSVFGSPYSMTGLGPITIGNGAAVALDSLIVGDTLIVDPSATYTVANTVYRSGALGLTDGVPYQNVVLDGSFVLAAPFHATTGTLVVRGTSNLTPNGHALDVGALQVIDQGTLTMQNPADSVVVRGQATFDGNSTSGLLSAGQLLLYGNFDVGSSNAIDAFAPTGNHTVRFSGSHGFHNANVLNSSNGTSWLRNVVVADTGTLNFNANTTVIGTLTVADSATLTANSGLTLEFFGAVAFGNDATVKQSAPDLTMNYNFSVAAGTNVTYDVKQSNFYSSTTLPALTYNEVAILDGSHIFMAQDVATSGNLTIASTSAGNAVLDLNGHTLTTNALIVGTGGLHGQLVMTHPTDSLIVNASANFGGDDESTSLTDGVIRIGGSFTQTSNVSGSAFAATGTRTEFYGTGIHPVGFSSPAPGLSHFADLALLDGGTLQPTTGLTATGGMTIDTSSIFDGAALGSGQAEFFGKVKILDLGQVNVNNNFNTMFFHDSLIVAPTGSYSGFNSIFQGTDGIPNASYVHMYLRQGVHLTLTHPLYMTGGLNIQNDSVFGSRADTVTIRLNGYKLGAFNLGITGYGRITMDNPADTLEIGSSAGFGGVDEDTSLSAGVIRIGGTFVQNGNYSPRSYAPAGTRTEFYGSLTHSMSFTDFGIGESHFADLAVVNTGTLQPLTMFNVTGTTTIGGGAHFNGQLIPLGSVIDFHGPVTVQSGGDFLASTSPAFFNFYGNGGLTVLNGAASPYDVLNTGFVGNNAIPDLPYKNLFLAGKDSLLSGNVTADSIVVTDSTYVGSGVTLHANHGLVVDGGGFADQGVLKVDGGTLQADSSFATQNAGYLVSRNAANAMTMHHVLFDGGPETVNLTAGQLNVTGNFTSGIGTSFDADSLFVVNFTGGGKHDLNLGNALSQFFGELRVTASGTDSDTLDLQGMASSVQMYTLATVNTPRIVGADQELQTQALAVSGANFEHIMVHLYTTSDQPMSFDNVTFSSMSASDMQLHIEHPGNAATYTFSNINFDDIASGPPTGGRFLWLNNNGASSPVLAVGVYGPDYLSFPLQALLETGFESISYGASPP